MTTEKKLRLAVLGSGSGSNAQSFIDSIEQGKLNAEIVIILSDIPNATILDRAARYQIPAEVIDCQGFKNKFPEEAQLALAAKLQALDIDFICLAGFMRLVKEPLLSAFPNRILNIHPSLLPDFPGIAAWKQALEAGASRAGCTVHYVDAGMDTGEIIMQAQVPVLPDDTAESLHARIQVQEHILYPAALLSAAARLAH